MVTKHILSLGLLIIAVQASAQNHDESKVKPYTLPEVLETSDGDKITSPKEWEGSRRPELLQLFEDHVYGQMPSEYDSLGISLTNEDQDAMGGKAVLKEIALNIWKGKTSVKINLTLFLPKNVTKPVPLFLLINNRPEYNTDPTRFIKSEFWPAETVIDNQYAIAAFQVSDAAPDHKENYPDGVLRLYPEQLKADNGMKAIGAWAWAASRIMDYFEKENDIDENKVALVGHSRGGKASLWAGAQDQRFSIIISNNSGNTGASLSKRNFGESVKMINTNFPHWFADNYNKYNDNEAALPIDQHQLIALIAPRPVYITNATEDLHADPKGSYLALFHAQEVYGLYNIPTTLPKELPAAQNPVDHPYLGYHLRKGIHNLALFDWEQFIRFADIHFK
ncbi:MAG: prolyl oligopeptidase family serine peptidase [Cyclobacteriaceae bacterium]